MAAVLADMITDLLVNGKTHPLMKRSPLAQAKPR
jgi:hypothetical protein